MSNSFVRKIIYIGIIVLLLFPLSMISRPSVQNISEGGILARLRTEHNLAQSELSEIDPASETMKLASLGLRGVAVNMLWMQAIDQKKKEEFDNLASTLKSLTKLQPNFVKVWEFQAHNLAYNVSMEFDDYEYRYQWVKRGLDFMKDGIRYNTKDHRVTDMLGFMTGNKFGKSDEKTAFRRMFGKDVPYHQSLANLIGPDTYDVDIYGPDSWLLASQWYQRSLDLVDKGAQKYRSDVMFYKNKPSQVRHRGISLQNEHRTDDVIQNVWIDADRLWQEFGDREIDNYYGVPFQLNEGRQRRKDIKRLREDLDVLVPGKREELLVALQPEDVLSQEEEAILNIAADQRTEAQQRRVDRLLEDMQAASSEVDFEIAKAAPAGQEVAATRIARDIDEQVAFQEVESSAGSTVNFDFWADRTSAEVKAVEARQALFDARKKRRQSIYDDEFDIDFMTKKKSNIRKGAISLYIDAFSKWSAIFKEFPALIKGPLSDEIAKEMHQFQIMLNTSNLPWPDDFPLQWLVDLRAAARQPDRLPTSEALEELRTSQQELE